MLDMFYYLVVTNVFWVVLFALLFGMGIFVVFMVCTSTYGFMKDIEEGVFKLNLSKREKIVIVVKCILLFIFAIIALSIIF